MSVDNLAAALGNGWQVNDDEEVIPVPEVDITNPLFNGVTITDTTPIGITPGTTDGTDGDGSVTFKGTYNSMDFTADDKSILFLGAENTLYWPQKDASIGAFRAYFQLNGFTAGPVQQNPIRAFVLNFGDNESAGITTTTLTNDTNADAAWHSLDGRKLSAKPQAPGVYIHGSKKVYVK